MAKAPKKANRGRKLTAPDQDEKDKARTNRVVIRLSKQEFEELEMFRTIGTDTPLPRGELARDVLLTVVRTGLRCAIWYRDRIAEMDAAVDAGGPDSQQARAAGIVLQQDFREKIQALRSGLPREGDPVIDDRMVQELVDAAMMQAFVKRYGPLLDQFNTNQGEETDPSTGAEDES